MRDEKGLYYYPQPGNQEVKMYVRRGSNGEIQFRLWEAAHPEVWEMHEWISHDVLEQAASLYKAERNPNAEPMRLYDLKVAQALLSERKA